MDVADRPRIVLACMTPMTDGEELSAVQLPSYGVRRIVAAVATDPVLREAGAEVSLVDLQHPDIDGYVAAILAHEPDLIGFSIYVWSTATMVEVARRIKRQRPDCTIVFGGPSARTVVFDLPQYRGASAYLDAVISTEGEITFRDLARLGPSRREQLRTLPGLHLPTADGWESTGSPRPLRHLDEIPSPYQWGLMEPDAVAYLETYRGCPLSCTFCEWGMSDPSSTVFSTEYLVSELRSIEAHRAPAVFLVDAGLNLNARAFRNLRAAEELVQVLRNIGFWCEVYPARITDDHVSFLRDIGPSWLGMGLQSLDGEVLKRLQRPFGAERLVESVERLLPVAERIELQIIFGLPTDTPAGFLRTLEFARSLPVAVRAYHCLVLPDALLTRGDPTWNMRFDQETLAMTSCAGWTEDDLLRMRAFLTDEALSAGGSAGQFWWSFPAPERAAVQPNAH